MRKYYYNILFATFILASLVIIPMFQSWAGSVIPDVEDYGTVFPEIVEAFEDGEEIEFEDLEISGPIVAMIFGVIVLLASCLKNKVLSIIFSFAEIVWLLWAIGSIIYYNDYEVVFDFENTAVTIGFWTVFILFIACFINSICIKTSPNRYNKEENNMGLISDMGKKISSTSHAVVERTQKITATTKLNFAINEAKEQIEKYYKQIGEMYFTKYQNTPSEELFDLVEKIKAKYSEIDKINIQIIELKGFTICPQCGAEVPTNTNFCGMCGFKVEIPLIAEKTENRCPQCGNEASENNKFCSKCGYKITNDFQNDKETEEVI